MIWKAIKVLFYMTLIWLTGKKLTWHVWNDQMQVLYDDPIFFVFIVGLLGWALVKFFNELNDH